MLNRKVVSRLSFVCVVLMAAMSRGTLAAPAGPSKDVFVEPFDVFVSAAESCTGEEVHIFGTLDIHIQTNTDGKGNTHVMFHLTPHLIGIGLTSGDTYNPTGPSNTNDYIDGNGPRVSSGINIINLISTGSGGNLQIRESYHATITPQGSVTVDVSDVRAGCRG